MISPCFLILCSWEGCISPIPISSISFTLHSAATFLFLIVTPTLLTLCSSHSPSGDCLISQVRPSSIHGHGSLGARGLISFQYPMSDHHSNLTRGRNSSETILPPPHSENPGLPFPFRINSQDFPVVEWLRLLHVPKAVDPGLIPGQGTKIPQTLWCSQKNKTVLNY